MARLKPTIIMPRLAARRACREAWRSYEFLNNSLIPPRLPITLVAS